MTQCEYITPTVDDHKYVAFQDAVMRSLMRRLAIPSWLLETAETRPSRLLTYEGEKP